MNKRDACSAGCLLTVNALRHHPRPPKRTRREYMKLAFRQDHRCVKCRDLLHWDSQVDHIIPWSLSADDSESNVQILCPNCHANKSGDEAWRIRHVTKILSRPGMADLNQAVCWSCLDVVSLFFRHKSPAT